MLKVSQRVGCIFPSSTILRRGLQLTKTRCSNVPCHYSYRAHQGKPKGSLNKKTIERIKAARAAAESEAQPDHITSQGSSACPRPVDDVLDFIDMPPSTCHNSPDPVTATPTSHFPLMGETFPAFGADDLDSFLVSEPRVGNDGDAEG